MTQFANNELAVTHGDSIRLCVSSAAPLSKGHAEAASPFTQKWFIYEKLGDIGKSQVTDCFRIERILKLRRHGGRQIPAGWAGSFLERYLDTHECQTVLSATKKCSPTL